MIEERLKQTIAEAMVEGTGSKDQQAGGARHKGGKIYKCNKITFLVVTERLLCDSIIVDKC